MGSVVNSPIPGDKPLVSVIIPTYNRAAILPRAIESVLAQSFGHFELVVVDDGSTDDTRAAVDRFADRRIIYLRHAQNSGGAAARNTGIDAARGRHVAFLDSDDEWLPDKLARQVAVLEQAGSEMGAVYCAHTVQDDTSARVEEGEGELHTGDVFQTLLRGWCPASTSLFLVRRDPLVAVGGFDDSLPSFQDYDLWLRLAQICRFDAVAVPLVIKHAHAGIQISRDARLRQAGLERFLKKWQPVIERETGSEGFHALRRKYLFEIVLNRALAQVEQGRRLEALATAASYRALAGGVTPRRAAALVAAVVGGPALYAVLEKSWRGWRHAFPRR